MKLSQWQDHPEILVLSRDLVNNLQLTLKELINAELVRAELIFAELNFAEFVLIRKNWFNKTFSKSAIRKN